ncbi:unnamed protein product [Ceratitis capitata]|uniref:(Mediterranean fruit fly) hypothetical protein n=1 Tax=Ceratitis capitata TaxID=7213 RepID=A0A811VHQ9_CERCA|nr:unnamed protein product [Ceratitis capitata]
MYINTCLQTWKQKSKSKRNSAHNAELETKYRAAPRRAAALARRFTPPQKCKFMQDKFQSANAKTSGKHRLTSTTSTSSNTFGGNVGTAARFICYCCSCSALLVVVVVVVALVNGANSSAGGVRCECRRYEYNMEMSTIQTHNNSRQCW